MGKQGKQNIDAAAVESLGKELHALAKRCEELHVLMGSQTAFVEGLAGTNEFKDRTHNFLTKIEQYLRRPIPIKAAEPQGNYDVGQRLSKRSPGPKKKSGRPKQP